MLRLIGRLPQPLKTLYVLYFAAFAATFVSVVVHDGRVTTLTFGVLGAIAALTGLTIATDVNGCVDAVVEGWKTYRPMGVDYSRSVFATPIFTRVFGLMMLAIGVLFVVVSITQL